MNKIFCVSCGHKIEYATSKPRFCSSCGESVSGESKASRANVEDDDIETGDIDIEKLRETVEASSYRPQGFTIGDLINTSSEVYSPRAASNDPEGKAIIAASQELCKSSKGQSKDIDG
jgi:predicted RNA-binding Zn-ribbon protein involved in translation (DUF1610 family)